MKTFKSWNVAEKKIINELSSGRVRLLTVDVFDTLLRRITSPNTVLHGTAQFASSRTGKSTEECSESRFRAWNICIADSISNGFDADSTSVINNKVWARLLIGDTATEADVETLANDISNTELELEIKALRPNTSMKRVLEYAKELSIPVHAVSDMYLTSEEITQLISAHGMLIGIDKVHSSGEYRLQKKSGRLFAKLSETLSKDGWLHIGDDPLADGYAAKRNGISSIVVRDRLEVKRHARNKVAFEKKGETYARSLIDSAISASPKFVDPAIEYGRTFLGPIYASFIHGVIAKAHKDGVGSVWYMAREGAVLREIHNIARNAGINNCTPAGYLMVSRLSTLRASMSEGYGDNEIKAVISNTPILTAKKLLAPLLMEQSELNEMASEVDISLDEPLSYPSTTADKILQNARVIDAINRAKIDQTYFHKYLKNIGFMGAGKVGVVDVGWGGQIQMNLEKALEKIENSPIVFGYYLGTNGAAEKRREQGINIQSIIVDQLNVDRHGHGAFEFVQGLELAVRASHGSVTGYNEKGPTFATGLGRDREVANDQTIAKIQLGITKFCHDFMPLLAMAEIPAEDTADAARTICDLISLTPERRFAQTIINLDNVANLGMDEGFLLGKKVNPLNPMAAIKAMKETLWQEGTAGATYGAAGSIAVLMKKRKRYSTYNNPRYVMRSISSEPAEIRELPKDAYSFAEVSWANSVELSGKPYFTFKASKGIFTKKNLAKLAAIDLIRDKKITPRTKTALKIEIKAKGLRVKRSRPAEALKEVIRTKRKR